MAKTIYSQYDHTALILRETNNHQFYSISGEVGIIDGLSKDDIVEGFPISLEATFNGKTIVKNLPCIFIEADDSGMDAVFSDSPDVSQTSVGLQLVFPASSQAYVWSIAIDKDLAESVFGQPSSEAFDNGTSRYLYAPVKIVTSSVEEDPFAKFVKNYSDKDASEVKAPMFDELKKYLIAKLEMSEETAKTAFANCYSITDLLNAICNYVEAHKNAGT